MKTPLFCALLLLPLLASASPIGSITRGCPVKESYEGREEEGAEQTIRRQANQKSVQATLTSNLYDIYRACRMETRYENQCHPVIVNGVTENRCELVGVPSPTFYKRRQLVESRQSQVRVQFDAQAILLAPIEDEQITLRTNAFAHNTILATIASPYYNYRIVRNEQSGYGTFEITAATEQRKLVRPDEVLKVVKVRRSGGHLYAHLRLRTGADLKGLDNTGATVQFRAKLARREFVSYSKQLADIKSQQSVTALGDQEFVMDIGQVDNSNRKHQLKITLSITGSRFYNNEIPKSEEKEFFLKDL